MFVNFDRLRMTLGVAEGSDKRIKYLRRSVECELQAEYSMTEINNYTVSHLPFCTVETS